MYRVTKVIELVRHSHVTIRSTQIFLDETNSRKKKNALGLIQLFYASMLSKSKEGQY